MGNDNDHFAGAAAGILQQFQDIFTGDIVQSTGGLVTQQQLGFFGQRAGDGDALSPPPDKLIVTEILGELWTFRARPERWYRKYSRPYHPADPKWRSYRCRKS